MLRRDSANKGRRSKLLGLGKRSKTIPVQGFGDDANKYYKCWNCGFVCKMGRDKLGGPESRGGNSSESVNITVIERETETVESATKATVSAGCPLCGSMNWRGDY